MQLAYLLSLYGLFGGSCLYLVFCADPHGKGPISMVRRKYGEKTVGRRPIELIGQGITYLCYKNHPLVQIFYVGITAGGFFLYVKHGFMVFYPSKNVSTMHIYLGTALTLCCFHIYYKVSTVKPGIITQKSVKHQLNKYDYDGIVFREGELCRTCMFKKPARSKHCRVCNVCVSKFDHHCVWIKQCVGEKNYKWFLLYIGMHSLLCFYGTYVGVALLFSYVDEKNLATSSFRNEFTGETVQSSWWIITQYLFYRYTHFFFVLILCAVMGFTLSLFTIYHLHMVSLGHTTNEGMKISDLQYRIEKQIGKINKELSTSESKMTPEERDKLLHNRALCQRDGKRIEAYGERGLIKNLKVIFNE